jgi:hypothetical protein
VVALEFHELVESKLAQGDSAAGVLPASPGKVLTGLLVGEIIHGCDRSPLTGLG